MIDIPSLSFCITCKNRLHQLKETLSKNLFHNYQFKHLIDFVIVDFGSDDNVTKWVCENYKNELNDGYLKYFFSNDLPYWHASIAKNTSHLLAQNKIVVNLDADNFTGKNGGKFVIRNFLKYGENTILHQFSGTYGDGTFGRIALTKKNFLCLGGYDESFEPMGFQDHDLILRGIDYGLFLKEVPNNIYSNAIRNTKVESIKNCQNQLSYEKMNKINFLKSKINRGLGLSKSNLKNFGIRKNIFNHRGVEIEIEICEQSNIIGPKTNS